MRKKRDIVRAGVAIIVTMVGLGLIRLIFPALDYYAPESITRVLEPSWAFFAFGVIGHSWTWFHLFIPIMDVAGLPAAGRFEPGRMHKKD